MSYQVLARKYRPHGFDEMVGQEHVLTALTNALNNQRLHHAYIFSGTRGVGKTTVARIFAKCLNNPDGVSATPDENSEIALAIDKGQFIDLIEVDAASRTKVEQTRELLENVTYPPTQGRFKIYLIDEAHQLSASSFNALLKTLEEPPEFVKFLFATTEPQKLPITIVSRSLMFHLRQIPEEQIKQQLEKILKAEEISYDQQAVDLLARAGRGSLRDALSITDQAIAHTNSDLNGADLAVFLGMLDLPRLEQLVDLLLASKVQEMLALLRDLADLAPNYDHLVEQLLQLLQQAAVEQFAPQTMAPPAVVKRLAEALTAETIQLYYQLLLRGKEELAQLHNSNMGFAMLMLRLLAFTPAQNAEDMHTALAPQQHKDQQQPSPPQHVEKEPVDEQQAQVQANMGKAVGIKVPLPQNNDDWLALFPMLELEGFARHLAGYSSFAGCDEEGNLSFDLGAGYHKMLNQDYHRQIVTAMRSCLDAPFHLRYNKTERPAEDSPLMRQKLEASGDEEVRKQLAEDPEVGKLLKDFDGSITNITTPYSPTTNPEDSA